MVLPAFFPADPPFQLDEVLSQHRRLGKVPGVSGAEVLSVVLVDRF